MMMSKLQQAAPMLRFKGYTDAWVQRKLGEILSEKISNGIMNKPGRNELNIKHINVVNLYSPSYIHINELEYINASESDMQRCNIEIGDIFLTRSSLKVEGIAHANILLDDGNLVFDDHIMRVKLNEDYEPFFVKEALNHSSTKKQFMTKAKTGTMTTIGQDDISSSSLTYPTKLEQTAIGNFFSTLDTTITLHKRKLDGLKELRNGYLQRMFLQNGESVPRVRFEGYTDEWEIKKASEVFTSISDKNHSYLPVLSASQEKGMVLRDTIGIDIKYDENALGTYKRILPGQFAIHLRSFQGGFAHSTIDGITSPAYTILDFKHQSEHASGFWKEVFTSPMFIKRLETITYGIRDGRSINFSEFSTLTMPCPPCNEQVAISDFFYKLDKQIVSQHSKLESLKQLKHAYLQMMFM